MAWSERQLDDVQVSQRVTASLSLIGCLFIILTFSLSASFRKPINRLIFFASFGNIFSAVAYLIGRKGVIDGQNSVTCQLQAFFIQQWQPADPLWSFCMALNVYLTFYKRYTAPQLRSLEWKYFALCYGVPLIPNLAMFFVRTKARGRIYGPAVLWCSITSSWSFLRIACFYGPIWLISLASLWIFVWVGRDIFRADRNFRRYVVPSNRSQHRGPITHIAKTTTVEIEREELPLESSSDSKPIISNNEMAHISSTSTATATASTAGIVTSSTGSHPRTTTTEVNTSPVARSYLRCALLFFLAAIVTWAPSSINRIYSLVKPDTPNYPLNALAATVLPLQGFWNFVIYITTTSAILSEIWGTHVMSSRRNRGRGPVGTGNRQFASHPMERNHVKSVVRESFGKTASGYIRTGPR